MPPFDYDQDDRPDDLVAEAARSRYERRSGFCAECHCSGGHYLGCPEDLDQDRERPSYV